MSIRSESGLGLVAVVVATAVLLVAGASALRLTQFESRGVSRQIAKDMAFYAAEAGLQLALARLELDRSASPPSTGTGYAASLSRSLSPESFVVTIADEPGASDPGRKLIQSTGTALGEQAVIEARVFVQDPPDACPILLADTGRAEFAANVSVLSSALFDGDIHSNTDVRISLLAGLQVNATGAVTAVGDFYSNNLLTNGSVLDATLERGGDYLRTTADDALFGGQADTFLNAVVSAMPGIPTFGPILATTVVPAWTPLVGTSADAVVEQTSGAMCTVDGTKDGDLLSTEFAALLAATGQSLPPGLPIATVLAAAGYADVALSICPGIWFSNGDDRKGVQVAVPTELFPMVDFEGVKSDPNTIVVSEHHLPVDQNGLPIGNWDSATDTWTYTGPLVLPGSPDITYYVEGNAELGTLTLAEEARAAVVARGYIAVQEVALLTGPVSVADIVATRDASTVSVSLSVDASVPDPSNSRGQMLSLIAEDDVFVGGPITSELQTLTAALGLATFLDPVTAPGYSVVALGAASSPLTQPVQNRFIAYSRDGTVSSRISGLGVDSVVGACFIGRQNAVISQTASVASSVIEVAETDTLPAPLL